MSSPSHTQPTNALPTQRVRALLETASSGRVLVVGDCMLDRYVVGDVERISPEAPVPVVRVREDRAALGGAANVAAGVAALGGSCRLAGVTGADEAGGELRELLAETGIDHGSLLEERGRPTTVKTRVLARHQQMLRVDRESTEPLPDDVLGALRDRLLEDLEWANALVLEDYDKGVLTGDLVRDLLERAAGKGIPSVVDPKLRRFFEYREAFLFKPNGRELAAAEGRERPPMDRGRLDALRRRLGVRNLLLTLGGEGMVLVDAAGARHEIPALPVEVYDVSGAGDTVTAVLAAVLGGDRDVLSAARLANAAAGVAVTHLGAVPVTREEILARYRIPEPARMEESGGDAPADREGI